MSAPGEADKLEDNTTLVDSEEGGMDKKSDWVDDWVDEDSEYDEGSSDEEADNTGCDIWTETKLPEVEEIYVAPKMSCMIKSVLWN